MTSPERRREMGAFLRTCREKTPPDSEEAKSVRRRTPGLRREEVAARSGVGITWYTWLEQGRDVKPTPATLQRIAKALEMTEDERQHLFNLAAQSSVPAKNSYLNEVTPQLQHMLDALNPTPAFFLNRKWDRIGWNDATLALMGDFRGDSGFAMNTVWRMFMHPHPRIYTENWEMAARILIAEFYTGTRRFMEQPEIKVLVERLLTDSPEFRAWWPTRDVALQRGKQTGFHHPIVGYIAIERLYFEAIPSRDATLCIFSPADGVSHRRLEAALEAFRAHPADWNERYMRAAQEGQG